MSNADLDHKAKTILTENDQGGYTIPTKGLYPYQWNWDSVFVALGFATFAVVHPAPDLGGQLFLKDLYVARAARGSGIQFSQQFRAPRVNGPRRWTRRPWPSPGDQVRRSS